jgi:hypothetical protein
VPRSPSNLAAQYPDVVKRLKTLADQKAAALCDGKDNKPGVRDPGNVDNPKPLYPMTRTSKKDSHFEDQN